MKIDAKKIVQLLAEKGMTKTALANNAGISKQSISTIIGRGTCSTVNAGRIAEALDIPVKEIMLEV